MYEQTYIIYGYKNICLYLWGDKLHTEYSGINNNHDSRDLLLLPIKDLSPTPHQAYTLTLKQLHWLLICARIMFRIYLLMYNIQSGTSPSYMSSMVTPCSASSSRGCRSSIAGDLAVICTNLKFGNCAFSVSGLREWNSIPVSGCQCTFAVKFKSKFQKHLFSL